MLTGGTVEWIHQFGGTGPEFDSAQAVDGDGNIYVLGYTGGTLSGETSAGGGDVFVRKYDSRGKELWTEQFGTESDDYGTGISVDSSGVYVVGFTAGTFAGETSAGNYDVFVRKLNASDGSAVWTEQFGTGAFDRGTGIAVDSSGVYVVGETGGTFPGETRGNVFVRKLNGSNGSAVWTEQFGSGFPDFGTGISVDSTGVYVVGFTIGTFAGETSAGDQDVFVRKLNASDGSALWTEQFGTGSSDFGTGISVDSTGVYVVGYTGGTFSGETSAGGSDVFVRKLSASDGSAFWTEQFGTGSSDFGTGISVDSTGVYVVGFTIGTFAGETSAGGEDVFVRKLNGKDGSVAWTEQFGTGASDRGTGISVDSSGVYVVGETDGTFLGETSAGGRDVFVRKLNASDGSAAWAEQFGGAGPTGDFAQAVDSDGSIYVLGSTNGSLHGETSAGNSDVFVRKYDSRGNELWTEQFGTSGSDFGTGIAVDSSGVYVVGYTGGTFLGETSAGGSDVFVRKLSASDGSAVWTEQFGTGSSDFGTGISVDSSGVYVVGFTAGTFAGETSAGNYDVFVRKLNGKDGSVAWTEQFGTGASDRGTGISVDSSGVYVIGETDGTFLGETSAGGRDVFVRKLNASDGSAAWAEQFGTGAFDRGIGISVDSSGVYVVGETHGTFSGETSAGGVDVFVRKYDSRGSELWTEQFGTESDDYGTGISVDSTGVYVVGETDGTFSGETSAGGRDVFVRKLNASDGSAVWTEQFGTGAFDRGTGIAVDSSGVYVVGYTSGTFAGETSAGGSDVFVAKLVQNTPPTADVGGPYSVGEGGSLRLDASSTTDPDQAASTLSYAWDLDGDGVFGETGAAASCGDEMGMNPVFSAGALDGPTFVTVTLLVTDDGGLTSSHTATINVTNAAPTPSIVSIGAVREEGTAIAVSGTASDPAGANDTLSYAWAVYKDGSLKAYASGVGSDWSFTPDDNGSYLIVLTVSDEDGGSASAEQTISVANLSPTPSIRVGKGGQEGTQLVVQAVATDPAEANDMLTYRYDVIKDGATTTFARGSGVNLTSFSFTPDDNGSYRIVLRVSDEDGGSASAEQTIAVANVPPTPIIEMISATQLEGTQIEVTASATDPAGDNDTLTYIYQVFKHGAITAFASGSGVDLTGFGFTPDDNGSYRIVLTVWDEDCGKASAEQTISVANLVPTATISGPATGVRGQTQTFTFNANDPSEADQAAGFTYAIDWDGDGAVDETFAGPDGLQVSHVFEANGSYAVNLTATDKDLGTSTVASHSVKIGSAAQQGNNIHVGGTGGNDKIKVSNGSVIITFLDASDNLLEEYTFADVTGSIIVHGYRGDDQILVDSAITNSVELYGGDGNDLLVGGSGNDLLDGGAGDDQLKGGAGDDTFDGGSGSNALDPGPGNDSLGLGYALTIIAPGSFSGGSDAVRGQTVHFAASGTLPDGAQLSWAFGNTLSAGNSPTIGHAYTDAGSYSVQLSVLDALGARNTISRNIQIATWALQQNPQDGRDTDFAIGGTAGGDHIVFSPGANAGEVEAILNGVSQGVHRPTGRLIAFGQAGDDDLQVAGSISLSAWLYGDAGNDRLKGGAGHDALFGGDGDDLLVGGGGRDLLIGGLGADRIVGNADDDVLIAGFTAFDYDSNGILRPDHEAAIRAILAEWTSVNDYQVRIDNLKNGTGLNGKYVLNGTTLGNDDAGDVLTGSAGDDWFLFDSALDRATDLKDEAFANDMYFILS